jgi:hypothetical protein
VTLIRVSATYPKINSTDTRSIDTFVRRCDSRTVSSYICMLRRITLLTGCAFIVTASFMFTLSVIDNGLTASYLALLHFFNP